jgi:cytochrome c5
MKNFISNYSAIIVFALSLSACSANSGQNVGSGEQFRPPVLQAAVVDDAVLAKWARSCALCHVTGEAGAPVVGDTAEWQLRLQKGEEAILNNVLHGVNSMPPLGYCMACEVSDFRAMIIYMAGLN